MLHLLILRYTVPAAQASVHVADHVEFLERHHADGTFLLSGQTIPEDVGDAIIATSVDRADVERICATDPFVIAGVASYDIVSVSPGRTHPVLHDLLGLPAVEDIGWDRDAFNQLQRNRNPLAVLTGRSVRPVLQHAGQAILRVLVSSDANLVSTDAKEAVEHARRCITALEERFWVGDYELALELRQALGESLADEELSVPVKTIPVDLSELGDHLEGDPMQGTGYLDLHTGTVWPPGITDYDPPEELDEDAPGFDPDRWLPFDPESGEGYRDMLAFTDQVTSDHLRTRLLDALDGRGAFRRFRNVLHDAPEEAQTQWNIFSQERTLGRARSWLATEGYRAAPTGPHQ